jgi:hypothetical protein
MYGWDCGLFGMVPLGMEWESGWIGKVPEAWCGLEGISFVESNAQISYGPVLENRDPGTTCVTTCLVWNDMLTN